MTDWEHCTVPRRSTNPTVDPAGFCPSIDDNIEDDWMSEPSGRDDVTYRICQRGQGSRLKRQLAYQSIPKEKKETRHTMQRELLASLLKRIHRRYGRFLTLGDDVVTLNQTFSGMNASDRGKPSREICGRKVRCNSCRQSWSCTLDGRRFSFFEGFRTDLKCLVTLDGYNAYG